MKANVMLTLSFASTKDMAAGGNISVAYPTDFFAVGILPVVAAEATSVAGLKISCLPTSEQLLIMSTRAATLPVSNFTVFSAILQSKLIQLERIINQK
jgi:hypothetical protein